MRFSSVDALFEAPPRPRNNKGHRRVSFNHERCAAPASSTAPTPQSWIAIMASHRTSSIGQY